MKITAVLLKQGQTITTNHRKERKEGKGARARAREKRTSNSL